MFEMAYSVVMDAGLDDLVCVVRFMLNAAYSDGYKDGQGEGKGSDEYRVAYADEFVCSQAVTLRSVCLSGLADAYRNAILNRKVR